MTRIRDLSPRERTLAAKAAALQAVVVPALKVFGFGKVKTMVSALAPLRKTGPQGEEAVARAREAARVVHGVARRSLPRATCVPRSLILWALLRRIGIESRIRFGAKAAGKGIEAHAWVEVGGEPVGEAAGMRGEFPPLEGRE
ncbi:MAG: lasso peptide biosynthesis B2 protein [Planctomycetes bacterium]|nr:lasso peptide biosynthesis B2 protein [Planctomycetota bacterium]